MLFEAVSCLGFREVSWGAAQTDSQPPCAPWSAGLTPHCYASSKRTLRHLVFPPRPEFTNTSIAALERDFELLEGAVFDLSIVPWFHFSPRFGILVTTMILDVPSSDLGTTRKRWTNSALRCILPFAFYCNVPDLISVGLHTHWANRCLLVLWVPRPWPFTPHLRESHGQTARRRFHNTVVSSASGPNK